MRRRWAGMVLVVLSIVIGTPVLLTLVSNCVIGCAVAPTFPAGKFGRDDRTLKSGWFFQDRVVWDVRPFAHVSRLSVDDQDPPQAFRWERSDRESKISVPVWPAPVVLAVIGALLWIWGARAESQATRTSPPRTWRIAILSVSGAAAIGAGLAISTLVVLSFGLARISSVSSSTRWWWVIGMESGSVRIAGFDDPKNVSWSDPYGAFRFEWTRRADRSLLVMCPVWPVVPVLFGAGFIGLRNARKLARRGPDACQTCGYTRTGLASDVCPECGAAAPPPVPPALVQET